MKKITKIIFLLLAIVFLMINSVYAADDPCKVSLTVTKTKLKPGDKVTLNVVMSNITHEEGISSLMAILNIPTNVFDIDFDLSDEANELVAQFDGAVAEGDVGAVYIGENDPEESNNKWNALILVDESAGLGLMAFNDDEQTQTQTVAKIKLTVLDDVDVSNAKVSLEDIQVYGSSNDAMDTEDSNIISFTIDIDEPEEIEEEDEPIAQAPANKASGNKVAVATTNTNPSDRSAPYTGVEDYFPGFVVIMLVAVALTTYYIYIKEYRNV